MAHSHAESDESYYLDQLCAIGISAAIGLVMFLLWYWNQLTNLAPKLWIYVMLGGSALMVLALIRGVALWLAVAKKKPGGGPDHAHDHGDHAHHTHEHGAHVHSHDEECCGHDHGDGAHLDHDHGWAPWRYVVLVLPVLLFLLLPPKAVVDPEKVTDLAINSRGQLLVTAPGMTAAVGDEFTVSDAKFDSALSVDGTYHVAAVADSVYTTLETVKAPEGSAYKGGGKARTSIPLISYKKVEQAANDAQARQDFKGKRVHLRGWFQAPNQKYVKEFDLVRKRMTCCMIDAVKVQLTIRSAKDVDVKEFQDAWVDVMGVLDFDETDTGYKTVLNLERIEKREPDAAQYID